MNIFNFISKVGSSDVERSLRLPDVQRPYEWGVPEVGMFCDSIFSAFELKRSILLGHVDVFVPNDRSPVVDLLDGQQRTTTLVLMLSILRHLILDRFNNTAQPPEIDRRVAKIFNFDNDGSCQLFNRFDMSGETFPCLQIRPAIVDAFFQEYIIERGYRWSKVNHVDTKLRQLVNAGFRSPDGYDHPLIEKILRNMSLIHERLQHFESRSHVDILCHLTHETRLVVTQRTGDPQFIPSVFLDANRIGLQLTVADQFKAFLLKALPTRERRLCAELWDNFICEMKGYSFGLSQMRHSVGSVPALDDLFTIIYQLNSPDRQGVVGDIRRTAIPTQAELTKLFIDPNNGLILFRAPHVFNEIKSVSDSLKFLFITCRLNSPNPFGRPFDEKAHSESMVTAMQHLRCLGRLAGCSTLKSRDQWIPIAVKMLIALRENKITDKQFLSTIQLLHVRSVYGWFVPNQSQSLTKQYDVVLGSLLRADRFDGSTLEECDETLRLLSSDENKLALVMDSLNYKQTNPHHNAKLCWFLQVYDEFKSKLPLSHHNTIENRLTLEHLYPRAGFRSKRGKKTNPTAVAWDWPGDSKRGDSLGNLFLLAKGDNSAVGAKSLQEKLGIVLRSGLPSALQFLDSSSKKWKEEDAVRRQKSMIDFVKEKLGITRKV